MMNQAMERKYWPKEDPIGKRVKLGGFRLDAPWMTIVGVYGDVHHSGLDQKRSGIRPALPASRLAIS